VRTSSFKILVQWDPDDQVWVTHVPDLNYMSTFGETRDEALENTKEAILGYLEAAAKEQLPVPESGLDLELIELEVVTA
jgi:predicted RNase H-like HicB family nuclease